MALSLSANAAQRLPGHTRPKRAVEGYSQGRYEYRRYIVKRILQTALLLVLGGTGVTLAVGGWFVHHLSEHLPSVETLSDIHTNPPTRILSSDGVLLATLQTKSRHPVPLSKISPFLVDATIATEDSRFYSHHGVDMMGVLRAMCGNLCRGNAVSQGGSTITQQLARTLYLSSGKTYRRKVEEILLAQKIEAKHSKQEILDAYLNNVYYGNGSYGAEAAAQSYFGKPAQTLTLGEAALLAGLPQRPNAFAPTQHLEAALQRRKHVLDRMVETGKITLLQKAEAEATPLHLRHTDLQILADARAPYFVTHVLQLLRVRYGREFLYSGAQIVTSLNWRMQQSAERALRSGLTRGGAATTGAIVAIDPATGFVRALVGGADFRKDQFNAVTQGIRQPGSAFKPFVYATAFDNAICNLLTQVTDAQLVYPDGANSYAVHNYDGRYRGSISVLGALRFSVNTIPVKLTEQVGASNVVDYAQRLGISTPLNPTLPLALGASGVRPLDLCSAYTAFANHGRRYDPAFVISIADAHGVEIYHDDSNSRFHENFLKPQTLDQINCGLREVVEHGTGAAADSIPDAHGKTGTTNSHRDAWFAGYTADLVAVVWMSHARKISTRDGDRTLYEPMGEATGGHLCAPVWQRFMAQALPEQRRIHRILGMPLGLVSTITLADLTQSLQHQSADSGVDNAQQTAQTDANPETLPDVSEGGSIRITQNNQNAVAAFQPDVAPETPPAPSGREAPEISADSKSASDPETISDSDTPP